VLEPEQPEEMLIFIFLVARNSFLCSIAGAMELYTKPQLCQRKLKAEKVEIEHSNNILTFTHTNKYKRQNKMEKYGTS
jgi:hypothetical protein